jgi:hypothetical protein
MLKKLFYFLINFSAIIFRCEFFTEEYGNIARGLTGGWLL